MKIKRYIIALIFILATLASCKKMLEKKSDQSLATPSTLNDLELILNNPNINNGTVLLNGMSDEYYFTYTDWLNRSELHQKGHIWDAQLNDYNDWSIQYTAAFNANTVLFNLDFISSNGDDQRWEAIKGAALFYRALTFYRIALLYAPQYDPATAISDLGIPLRLNADIAEKSSRSTVAQTYNQIISDLLVAANLLPNNIPNTTIPKTQPTKVAAYGLLARIYLQIGDYVKAKENANACLNIYNTLVDFNDNTWVTPASSPSIKKLNPEVIFYSMSNTSPNSNSTAKVDSNLYKSYDANDLRKTAYFNKNSDGLTYRFKGSYGASLSELFCGIATDEIYLIRAECLAREGNTTAAMKDLNDLLKMRWKKVNGVTTYIDQIAADANDALAKVIAERKKELVYREIRWPDLKRLGKQPAFASAISRNLNGTLYSLPPNDLRYTLLIPREVLLIVDLPQNPR